MFRQDSRGTIAISTAVGGVVLIAAVGAAYDVTRMMGHHHSLQTVADAAAMAAAMPEEASDKQRIAFADAAVEEYLRTVPGELGDVDPVVTVVNGGKEVTVEVESDVGLVFGGIVGKSVMPVGASATAEEVLASDGASSVVTSISIVLDLSLSMDSIVDKASKLDTVTRSLQTFMGKAAAATGGPDSIKTGLYTYGWGEAEASTEPLSDGLTHTSTALAVAQTELGSVPGPSMERAVGDIAQSAQGPTTLVYVADGAVDAGMADTVGTYLPDTDFFAPGAPAQCYAATPEMILAQDEASQELLKAINDYAYATPEWTQMAAFDDDDVKYDSNDSMAETYQKWKAILELSGGVLRREGGVEVKELQATTTAVSITGTTGDERTQLNFVQETRGWLVEEMQAFEEQCRPAQEDRVVDACDEARARNVRLVGIDLSGENGLAAETTRQCVFGQINPAIDADGDGIPDAVDHDGLGGRGSTDGSTYIAEDGSVYIIGQDAVSIQQSLDQVLRRIQRDIATSATTGQRTVRLVR